jgi:ABC-type Fe3+-hydroxamate transport system substrate-binding protein
LNAGVPKIGFPPLHTERLVVRPLRSDDVPTVVAYRNDPAVARYQELRPDLVLATTSGNDASLVSLSEGLGLPLYFTDSADLKGLLNSMTRLAELLGTARRGAELRRTLEARIKALQEHTAAGHRPRVLFLVWIDPPVVPGSGTFLNDALRLTGLDSITANAPAGWPTYDLESILEKDPDWIVAATRYLCTVAVWRDTVNPSNAPGRDSRLMSVCPQTSCSRE